MLCCQRKQRVEAAEGFNAVRLAQIPNLVSGHTRSGPRRHAAHVRARRATTAQRSGWAAATIGHGSALGSGQLQLPQQTIERSYQSLCALGAGNRVQVGHGLPKRRVRANKVVALARGA
jgi:hypothetical protein